jgi:hypothetical protein
MAKLAPCRPECSVTASIITLKRARLAIMTFRRNLAARLTSLIVLTLILWSVANPGTKAQTLTDPNPPGTRNTSSSATKSAGKKDMKACPEYGAGFVRMPGSDLCVKVGGFVEGGVVSRH